MASKGEGFGLPLIEAAYFNKPLLVRDIPVFREIAGDTANYFSGAGCNSLRQCLPQWLMKLDKKDQAPKIYPAGVTWQESCAQLIKTLLTSGSSLGDEHVLVKARTMQSSNNCTL